MKTYEAMFLLDPTLASDWPAAEAEINRLLDRADAKMLGVTSWGERKLAYPMGQWKRGLYALSYFEASPEKIGGLERDVQLSEKTIRILVLRRDQMTREEVDKALAAEPPSKTQARSDEWGGRPGGRGPGFDRPGRFDRPDRSDRPERGGADRTVRAKPEGQTAVAEDKPKASASPAEPDTKKPDAGGEKTDGASG